MSHTAYAAQIALLSDQNTVPAPARVAVAVAVVLTKWTTRARTRRSLRDLEPHMLRDIGLTEAQAAYEASLPFWRA